MEMESGGVPLLTPAPSHPRPNEPPPEHESEAEHEQEHEHEPEPGPEHESEAESEKEPGADDEWVRVEGMFLSELAPSLRVSAFQDGSWFATVVLAILTSLEPEAAARGAASRTRVWDIPLAQREAAAEPIITSACRDVVVAGASSALASTAAAALAAGTGFAAAGIAAGAAGAALAAEMVVSTRIQMAMVYDLALNYGYDFEGAASPRLPPSLILRMYHLASGGVGLYDPRGPFSLSPEDIRRSFVQAAAGDEHALLHVSSKMFTLLAKPIGVKLVEQTVLKSAVPVVSLLASSSWSYFSTQAVGSVADRELKIAAFVAKTVQSVVGAAPKLVSSLALQIVLFSSLLSSALLDGHVSPVEAGVYDAFVRALRPDPEIWAHVDAVVFGPDAAAAAAAAAAAGATGSDVGFAEDEDGFVVIETPPATPTSSSSSSCFTVSDGGDDASSWVVVHDPFDSYINQLEELAAATVVELADPDLWDSPFDVHAILTGLYLMAHASGTYSANPDPQPSHSASDLKLEFLRSMRAYLPAFDIPVSPLTVRLGRPGETVAAAGLPCDMASLRSLVKSHSTTCPVCHVLIVDLSARSPRAALPCALCDFERELKATMRPSPTLLAVAKTVLDHYIRNAVGPDGAAKVRNLQAAVKAMAMDRLDFELLVDDVSLVVARSSSSLQESPLGAIADTALDTTATLAGYTAQASVYAADSAVDYASAMSASLAAAADYVYAVVSGSANYRPVTWTDAVSETAMAALGSLNTL